MAFAGDLHTFHGAFAKKSDAEKKESTLPGSFIRRVTYKHGPLKGQTRYLVIRPGRGKVVRKRRDRQARKLRAERAARRRYRSSLEKAPF